MHTAQGSSIPCLKPQNRHTKTIRDVVESKTVYATFLTEKCLHKFHLKNVHIDISSHYIHDTSLFAKTWCQISASDLSCRGLLSEFPWEVCVGLWDHVWCIVMFMYRQANHLLT